MGERRDTCLSLAYLKASLGRAEYKIAYGL